ncbi:MAG TPA: tRNA-dihydrouridine synthase family protein [Patescibacteria group bacterium]
MDLKTLIRSQKVIGLSPMDGVTDEPLRLLQTKIAKPDIIFTEFVSAEGISRGGVKLYDQLLYSPEERPVIGQLFGKDPEAFYKSAAILCHLGFDGIDINMGCPAKTVTQHGSGAALIAKPDLAVSIIQAVKRGVDDYKTGRLTISDLGLNQKTLEVIGRNLKYTRYIPSLEIDPTVSVKTRLGVSEIITEKWLPVLLKCQLDFVTVHGRTLKQAYSGSADWHEIAKAVSLANGTGTLIWGNGDIHNLAEARQAFTNFGVAGVLIGRAALGNPWAFSDKIPDFRDRFDAALLHSQLFSQIFPKRRFDPMRRNLLAYASGHPRAKSLREYLVHANSVNDLLLLEADFIN